MPLGRFVLVGRCDVHGQLREMDRSDPNRIISDDPCTMPSASGVIEHDNITGPSTPPLSIPCFKFDLPGHEYQPLPHRGRMPITVPTGGQFQENAGICRCCGRCGKRHGWWSIIVGFKRYVDHPEMGNTVLISINSEIWNYAHVLSRCLSEYSVGFSSYSSKRTRKASASQSLARRSSAAKRRFGSRIESAWRVVLSFFRAALMKRPYHSHTPHINVPTIDRYHTCRPQR